MNYSNIKYCIAENQKTLHTAIPVPNTKECPVTSIHILLSSYKSPVQMIKSLALSTIRFRFHLKPIINTKRNKLHDIKGFPNYILENEMKWEIFDVLSVYYHLKNNFWNNFSSKSKTQLLTGLILRQPSAAHNLIKRFWMWSRRITKIYQFEQLKSIICPPIIIIYSIY